MSSKENLDVRRLQLQTEEKKLVADLEEETLELESTVRSSLKTLAVIGGGLLTVTVLYKLFASEDATDKPKKGDKKKNKTTYSAPSQVTASILSLAMQKLLPLAIEKFSSFKRKDANNE